MKFSTIIVSLGFAALTAAQSVNSTRSVSVVTPTQTSSYSPTVAACLGRCKESDVTCRAQCLGSAAPNDGAANATNECVAKCPKGDGSQAATDQYAQCRNDCINKIFLSTSAVPTATGSSVSGSGSGGSSAKPTSGGSPSSTASSTAGSSSNTGSSLQAGGTLILLLGVAAGVLAL